jgi:cytochrome c
MRPRKRPDGGREAQGKKIMVVKTLVAAVALMAASVGVARAECAIPVALNTCKACHELEPGKKSKATGPNISGVYGAKAMQAPDFAKYSEAMKAASEKGLTWTDDNLFKYLADQAGFLAEINGKVLPNAMKITSHKDEAKRREALAGLKEMKACK